MKKILLALCMLGNIAFGQTGSDILLSNIYDRFNQAIQNEDTLQMTSLIRQIQASSDESAERYIAEFNYYFNMSRKEVIALTSELPKGKELSDVFTLLDSTGQETGYMYSHVEYDPLLSDSAIATIDKGLALYPNRLDMRFGKIHVLQMYERWNAYTEEIMSTLNYSEKHHDKWVYPNAQSPIDTLIVFGILDYESNLLNQCEFTPESHAKDSVLLNDMRTIAMKMLQLYPNNVYYTNVVAITYNGMGDYENGVIWLKKAEALAPTDMTVLSNLADSYYNLGDRANEKKYIKKIIKYGDAHMKQYARRILKEGR
ncbi:MAG: hypothetical protein K6A41_09850 [Bacteroidales bacterium]|nr:hypothetical protein [Bacteroidales bacterium]